MKLRDLITELHDIAKRAGDHADVEVIGEVDIDCEDSSGWCEQIQQAVVDVRYDGGAAVRLIL